MACTKDVCASCGLFISFRNLKHLHHSHPILLSTFESYILVASDLDHCSKREHYFNFCIICYRQIIESNLPKFGFTSQINVCICQNYPDAFNNLTLVEEAVITHAHPVISILKLRPAGTSFSASYQQVRGYAVVLPKTWVHYLLFYLFFLWSYMMLFEWFVQGKGLTSKVIFVLLNVLEKIKS